MLIRRRPRQLFLYVQFSPPEGVSRQRLEARTDLFEMAHTVQHARVRYAEAVVVRCIAASQTKCRGGERQCSVAFPPEQAVNVLSNCAACNSIPQAVWLQNSISSIRRHNGFSSSSFLQKANTFTIWFNIGFEQNVICSSHIHWLGSITPVNIHTHKVLVVSRQKAHQSTRRLQTTRT